MNATPPEAPADAGISVQQKCSLCPATLGPVRYTVEIRGELAKICPRCFSSHENHAVNVEIGGSIIAGNMRPRVIQDIEVVGGAHVGNHEAGSKLEIDQLPEWVRKAATSDPVSSAVLRGCRSRGMNRGQFFEALARTQHLLLHEQRVFTFAGKKS